MAIQGAQTGVPCPSVSEQCPDKFGCTPGVCPDFLIKRHDTLADQEAIKKVVRKSDHGKFRKDIQADALKDARVAMEMSVRQTEEIGKKGSTAQKEALRDMLINPTQRRVIGVEMKRIMNIIETTTNLKDKEEAQERKMRIAAVTREIQGPNFSAVPPKRKKKKKKKKEQPQPPPPPPGMYG